jgi:hypothetical protein
MFGQFGSTVSQALATEFFQWFHLTKTGETPDGGVVHRTYQPRAPQFHDLVRVTLTADPSDSLKAVELAVKRSFIDSPTDYRLANDISEKFLLASLENEDAATMADAMSQIRDYQPANSEMTTLHMGSGAGAGKAATDEEVFQAMKNATATGRPIYATMKNFKQEGSRMVPVDQPRPEAPLPGEGDPAYLVYTGKRRQLEQKLGKALLRMTNGDVSGARHLTISVSPL